MALFRYVVEHSEVIAEHQELFSNVLVEGVTLAFLLLLLKLAEVLWSYCQDRLAGWWLLQRKQF